MIAAVRVPPSALSTSVSTWTVNGPERLAVDDRAEAPPDQPLDLGRAAVRARRDLRVGVLPGSIAYSAVSQPIPFPSRNGGTVSETCAVASTSVDPAR